MAYLIRQREQAAQDKIATEEYDKWQTGFGTHKRSPATQALRKKDESTADDADIDDPLLQLSSR